jgi:hypothetical protein
MSKHENTAVVAEQPKSKTGDKVEKAETPKTTVDAPAKERKPRNSVKSGSFRILDGVDAAAHAGQRGHVIRALQKLAQTKGADKHFTLEEIVANTEGLVSRTPVEASVSYHLKGLADDGKVSVQMPEAPAKAEKKDKAEKAA